MGPKRDLSAENRVRSFYEGAGWEANSNGYTTDAQLWEDLRPFAADYIRACRRKLLHYLPVSGERILDAASGPIKYPEYVEYSRGFKKRICVDISQKALDQAKARLGDHVEPVCVSILELPFEDSSLDAVISLHTIYHIDKDQQEAAVRQLLRVAKPGAPVVIIYSNPNKLLSRIKRIANAPLNALLSRKNTQEDTKGHLYFHTHPNSWWNRFRDAAALEIHPWRALTAEDARLRAPSMLGEGIGHAVLSGVLGFERIFPRLAADLGAYPLIVLKKSWYLTTWKPWWIVLVILDSRSRVSARTGHWMLKTNVLRPPGNLLEARKNTAIRVVL